jgi:hypothetical protein
MSRRHGDAAPSHKPGWLGSRGDAATRLERAVLDAEVTCLVNALSPFRVLHRDALARAAGAKRWHEEMFDRAIKAAVAQGQIMPLRFYALPSAGVREGPAASSTSDNSTRAKSRQALGDRR